MTSEPDSTSESDPTPNAQGETNKQTNQGNSDISRTPGVPSSPPSKTHYEIICKPEKSFWDQVKTGAEIFGIILLAIYTAYTIKMYCANRQAANAATSAANTASRQLEMMDRPWIKEVVRPAADLMANQGAFSWAVTIKIDNVGHSAATNIYPRTELIAPQGADFIDGPRRRVMELCKDASQRAINLKKDPMLWDTSVFPGDPVESNQNPILWPKDMEMATVDGGKQLGKSVPLMLVGCIAYDYPTASKFHETGFIYLIVHNDDMSIPESTRVFFSVSKTIPRDKLVVVKKGEIAN